MAYGNYSISYTSTTSTNGQWITWNSHRGTNTYKYHQSPIKRKNIDYKYLLSKEKGE